MPKGDRDEAFSEIRKGDKVYYLINNYKNIQVRL